MCLDVMLSSSPVCKGEGARRCSQEKWKTEICHWAAQGAVNLSADVLLIQGKAGGGEWAGEKMESSF